MSGISSNLKTHQKPVKNPTWSPLNCSLDINANPFVVNPHNLSISTSQNTSTKATNDLRTDSYFIKPSENAMLFAHRFFADIVSDNTETSRSNDKHDTTSSSVKSTVINESSLEKFEKCMENIHGEDCVAATASTVGMKNQHAFTGFSSFLTNPSSLNTNQEKSLDTRDEFKAVLITPKTSKKRKVSGFGGAAKDFISPLKNFDMHTGNSVTPQVRTVFKRLGSTGKRVKRQISITNVNNRPNKRPCPDPDKIASSDLSLLNADECNSQEIPPSMHESPFILQYNELHANRRHVYTEYFGRGIVDHPMEILFDMNMFVSFLRSIMMCRSREILSLTYSTSATHLFGVDKDSSWGPMNAFSALIKLGCSRKQIDLAWVERHYQLIVWKLASTARRFPEATSWFNHTSVIRQLYYRYERIHAPIFSLL